MNSYYRLTEDQFNNITVARDALAAFIDMTGAASGGDGAESLHITVDGFQALVFCVLAQLDEALRAPLFPIG